MKTTRILRIWKYFRLQVESIRNGNNYFLRDVFKKHYLLACSVFSVGGIMLLVCCSRIICKTLHKWGDVTRRKNWLSLRAAEHLTEAGDQREKSLKPFEGEGTIINCPISQRALFYKKYSEKCVWPPRPESGLSCIETTFNRQEIFGENLQNYNLPLGTAVAVKFKHGTK